MITAILDDDPTGTQATADVTVILDWSAPNAWDTVRPGDRAVHLLTNSRAHNGREAAQLVRLAAAAALNRIPGARVLLRGDSTLRAHVWEEYEALRSVVLPERQDVPLLLVPALPDAGRVTIDGVHLLQRENGRVPLHMTEYSDDGGFAYTSAVLSRWAEERSAGRLAAADAATVGLDRLRAPDGAQAVAHALLTVCGHGRPAVVVPDAETDDDLRTIAKGLRAAEATGAPVIVRSGPAFAATLTGGRASTVVRRCSTDRGALVLCGSFVPISTLQMEQLARSFPGTLVEAHVSALAGERWEVEVERVTAEARLRLDRGGFAAVAMERTRDLALADTGSQRRIAAALAQVARRLNPGVVIAKGGITSAVTAREGFDARAARVIGPVCPGVALWQLTDGRDYIVVPGNVGGPGLLVELVTSVVPSLSPSATARC